MSKPAFDDYPALYKTAAGTVTFNHLGIPKALYQEEKRLRHKAFADDTVLYCDLGQEKEEPPGIVWRLVFIIGKGNKYGKQEWIKKDYLEPYETNTQN